MVVRDWPQCNLPWNKTVIISKCVVIFLFLFLASLLMQFIRAKMRKNLVKKADPNLLPIEHRNKWDSIDNSLDFMFKDFRKLQIIKRNRKLLPNNIAEALRRYGRFSWAEMGVTISMLLFGALAFYLCR